MWFLLVLPATTAVAGGHDINEFCGQVFKKPRDGVCSTDRIIYGLCASVPVSLPRRPHNAVAP